MTKAGPSPIQSKGSSRHFLLSKTDTRALGEKILPQFSEIMAAISARFPELKTGKVYVDAALEHLQPAATFAALAVRLDRPAEAPVKGETSAKEWVLLAETLANECPSPEWIWGLIRPDALAACCRSLARARSPARTAS